MEAFKSMTKKRMVHCDIKCLKVEKTEYKRILNEHKS